MQHFDLPDLAACLALRHCWILNATDAEGEPLPESEVALLYKRPLETFEKIGDEIRLIVRLEGERADVVAKWLQSV